MRNKRMAYGAAAAALVAVAGLGQFATAQNLTPGETAKRMAELARSRPALYPLEDAFLDWPVAPADKAYAAIDGKQVKQYVNDLAAISRRYRDQGHQLWGRITGTSADVETQEWVLSRFKADGLTDIHSQEHALKSQWQPKSWSVTVNGNGKTLSLTTAQPAIASAGTPAAGIELEPVYVGTGSEADFIGRDVTGKLAVIYSNEQPSFWNHTANREGATLRAEKKGAAAVLIILNLPGKITTVLYPTGTKIPTLSVSSDEGIALRDMIGESAGRGVRVQIRVDLETPELKTATIFGILPGMSDENIYVVAHRDGFFEAGADNASGLATMVGLADYFSKVPKEKRLRTLVFVATTGHHNNCTGGPSVCSISSLWIKEHAKELFAKTALIINCEHTATVQTYVYLGPSIRKANSQNEALFWYVNGSPRLESLAIAAFRSFGVPTYAEPEQRPAGEMGAFYDEAPSVQVIDVGMFGHSDHETADVIPWTGLAGATRAYAKLIDGANTLDRKDLQPPARTTSQP